MSKKVKTLKEIRTILETLKPELVKKYKIKEIGVFGSWVRGEQKKNSDIDILVEFEENSGISLFDFIEIEDYLRKKVGIKVDLVEKKALKPHIGENILREVIYL
ncbi:nucleotidyltransferase family protein [Thermodesulfovibrio sp.]|uniref:nucleotidyltransferase family protein n=1 Tax=Thermodesulfovibrio sp. TaxID=2067987 RepID=UPI0030A335C8